MRARRSTINIRRIAEFRIKRLCLVNDITVFLVIKKIYNILLLLFFFVKGAYLIEKFN
jgi:hypothetical protein